MGEAPQGQEGGERGVNTVATGVSGQFVGRE